jgi:hypothetical protein
MGFGLTQRCLEKKLESFRSMEHTVWIPGAPLIGLVIGKNKEIELSMVTLQVE